MPDRAAALVTGASSGIGSVYAKRLAAKGYDLILVARRKDRLDALAEELRSRHGIEAEVLAADLADESDLRKVEEPDRMHRLHVIAAMRLCHAALSGMVARRKGTVVNVSSVAGFGQSPGNAAYCATKAWMNSFTEGLYVDLSTAGSPVKVQALCPGYTLTEFHDASGIGRGHVPASWWMTAEEVVDASLHGLARGQLFVVPGWRYKFYVFLSKVLPGFLIRSLMLRIRRGSRVIQ
jgi:short-subunit dehydrogenase